MRISVLAACILMVLAGAGAASAQTVVYDPSTVVWDHADFATATRYVLGFFALPVLPSGACDAMAIPAASPATTRDIAKPVTTTGIGMSASLPSYPVGCYVAKMQAVDVSGLVSAWSDLSDPFGRRPAATSRPVIR